MRKRKPTATSGPSCQRCTAVLFTGLDRCGMCGWPSGVGYPPADGELESAAVTETEDPAVADEHDQVGVQLDALAGMVERQEQPMPPQPSDAALAPPAEAQSPTSDGPAVEVAQETEDHEVTLEPADDAQKNDHIEATFELEEATGDIDPLTAPLTELSDDESIEDSPATRPGRHAHPDASNVDGADDRGEHADPGVKVEGQGDVDGSSGQPHATAPGGAAAILRPAQVLLVGTAVANLVVVVLSSLLNTSGSATGVPLGVALITLALWTGAAVTFLHWISRAHSHVAATAVSRQRHGASMSLLGWFIPIAGIVIGYRVLQDLWTGSDPATRDQVDAAPAKARMIDIWLLGIVTAALFGFLMPLALGESSLWAGVSGVGLLVAALGLVSTLGTISAWQSDSAAGDDLDVAETHVEAQTPDAETPHPVVAEHATATPEPISAAAE